MSKENPSDMPTDARERLRQNFLNHDPSTHPSRWEHMWSQNDLPWDKGFPSPALIDLLSQHQKDLLPQSPSSNQNQRLKALVPGCGKGYDVLLLASWGYDAVGLEASSSALAAAEKVRDAEAENPDYDVKDPQLGKGTARFVYGDFFQEAWEKDAGAGAGEWDLIYDYTFLCALPPTLRPSWSTKISRLLSPQTGRLICLEFPLYKPPSTGGPPWALRSKTYLALLTSPGEEPTYDEEGLPVFDEEDEEGKEKEGAKEGALVRIAHWKPERTHQIGEGTDWISVWKKV